MVGGVGSDSPGKPGSASDSDGVGTPKPGMLGGLGSVGGVGRDRPGSPGNARDGVGIVKPQPISWPTPSW